MESRKNGCVPVSCRQCPRFGTNHVHLHCGLWWRKIVWAVQPCRPIRMGLWLWAGGLSNELMDQLWLAAFVLPTFLFFLLGKTSLLGQLISPLIRARGHHILQSTDNITIVGMAAWSPEEFRSGFPCWSQSASVQHFQTNKTAHLTDKEEISLCKCGGYSSFINFLSNVLSDFSVHWASPRNCLILLKLLSRWRFIIVSDLV